VLRRKRVQAEIDGYQGTAGYCHDERLRLLLEIALLKREIIDNKIALVNITNERREEEERRRKEQIDTNEKKLHDLNQLRFPPQQMVVAQSGHYIFVLDSNFLTHLFLSFLSLFLSQYFLCKNSCLTSLPSPATLR
jgi:hypothetical protein